MAFADDQKFDALFPMLMSSSNADRVAAKAAFRGLRSSHPEALALHLAWSLSMPTTPEDLRAMAAVLLCELLSPTPSSDSSSAVAAPLWPHLSHSGQALLKFYLLSALQSDLPKPIAKKVCDAISELATRLLPENTWVELLPFLFRAASSPEAPNLQESALLIFARLAVYIAESPLEKIHNLLASALAHRTSSDVRIAALSAAVNLVRCLPTKADRDKMQDLLPAMMTALGICLFHGQEASAQEAIELLVDQAVEETGFLRRHNAEVLRLMRKIAMAAQLEDVTRLLAAEFVITSTGQRLRRRRYTHKTLHDVIPGSQQSCEKIGRKRKATYPGYPLAQEAAQGDAQEGHVSPSQISSAILEFKKTQQEIKDFRQEIKDYRQALQTETNNMLAALTGGVTTLKQALMTPIHYGRRQARASSSQAPPPP